MAGKRAPLERKGSMLISSKSEDKASFSRLVSPFSDSHGDGFELVRSTRRAAPKASWSNDSLGNAAPKQICRSVSATAVCGVRLNHMFSAPVKNLPRGRSFTPASAPRSEDRSETGSSVDDASAYDSEIGATPQMRHSATDPPEGRQELVMHTNSGMVRRMVQDEKDRWEHEQENWLLAAKQEADRQRQARAKFLLGDHMSTVEERLRIHSGANPWRVFLQIKVSRLLQSQFFDLAIGFVIIVNALAIGVEQSMRLNGEDTSMFDIFEIMFLSIYFVELSLRFFVSGWRCLKDTWVKFDSALLLMGVVALTISKADPGSQMGPWLVLRMFRLLRLARTVKLLMKFRNLFMLVRGLTGSANTMVPTLTLLLVILYIFGALGFEILKSHSLAQGEYADSEFQLIVDTHFSSLPMTVATLVQFISMDSAASVYKPLVKQDWLLAFYFYPVILVIFIVLMNLVTAVIVNSAFEQASQDREAQQIYEQRRKEKLVGELVKTFQALDINGDGQICRDELLGADSDTLYSLYENLKLDNPEEIFTSLDVDGTGEISIEEFCEGVMQAVRADRSIELCRMDKQIKSMKKQLTQMELAQAGFGELLTQVLEGLRRPTPQAGAEGPGPELPPVSVTFSKVCEETPPAWAAAMLQELRDVREAVAALTPGLAPRKAAERSPAYFAGPTLPTSRGAVRVESPGRHRRGLGCCRTGSLNSLDSEVVIAGFDFDPRGAPVKKLASGGSNAMVKIRSSNSTSSSVFRPLRAIFGAGGRSPRPEVPLSSGRPNFLEVFDGNGFDSVEEVESEKVLAPRLSLSAAGKLGSPRGPHLLASSPPGNKV